MRRIASAVLGVLSIAGILAFALWPLSPVPPIAPSVARVTDGQESFIRQLQLGFLYEHNGVWDKAQGAYEQAALSEQAEVAHAAQTGLERVLVSKQNPWLGMQLAVRTFLYWIVNIFVHLILIGSFSSAIWLSVTRLPRQPGYLILPFEDFTEGNLGKGLHVLVNLTMRQARRTHLQGQSDLLSSHERLEAPLFGTMSEEEDVLRDSLIALDSLSVGGVDLPLGKTLLAIRQWASTREHIVVGSLHQCGTMLSLSTEIRKAATGEVVQGWELATPAEGQSTSQIAALAEGLAFRILFTVCPELEAGSWRSLQLFTGGLRESQRYGTETVDQAVLERAAALLNEATILDPAYTSARYLLGIVYSNLGRYREARDQFREVASSNGRLVIEATYNLGLAFYHEFQDWAYNEAIARFKEVQKMLTDGKRDRGQMLLLALAHCGLASAYAQRVGRTAGSTPNETADEPLILVEKHSQEALDLIDDHEEVLAVAHNARGTAYLKAGRTEKAVAELKAAVQIRPNYPIAYVHLAEAYVNEEPDKAICWLERAMRWNPSYEYAYFRIGEIHARQGRTETAKEAYVQAPGISDAHNSLGEILAAEGKYENALVEFHEAARLNRRNARAWGNLAWWTIEAGKRDEETLKNATSWARRALELNRGTPYEWITHDSLGWILFHRGQMQEAEKELLLSIGQQRNRIQNHYHLACLYRRRGDMRKAVETLTKALGCADSSPWREKAESLMQELHQEAPRISKV